MIMRRNGITFDELRDLLLELGFSQSSQEPNRARFEHPGTGTVLLFRTHHAEETVNDREMVVVRRQLVDNGLIEAPAFDRFLQRASA
jgi:hypothetical protein